MSEKRFKLAYEKGNEAIFEDLNHPYPRRMTNKEVENLLNEQQSIINNQEQKIKILQQEINDTQAILEMLTEKLKGWK